MLHHGEIRREFRSKECSFDFIYIDHVPVLRIAITSLKKGKRTPKLRIIVGV